ncbi:hypothetical protein D3C72_2175130 [compost metagenome]
MFFCRSNGVADFDVTNVFDTTNNKTYFARRQSLDWEWEWFVFTHAQNFVITVSLHELDTIAFFNNTVDSTHKDNNACISVKPRVKNQSARSQ